MDFSKYEYEYIRKPNIPEKPLRQNYSSHTEYGKAMDEWENLLSVYREECETVDDKNRKNLKKIKESFKTDLVEDLGWGWMTEAQLNKVLDYAWEEGHSGGFGNVYSVASGLDDILELFRPS